MERIARFLPALLGVALLQTAIIGGVNASVADLILLSLLLAMATTLIVPRHPTVAFLGITSFTLFTAVVVTPAAFGTDIDQLAIARDLSKLVMSFLWFVIGFAITVKGRMDVVVRWFAWSGVFISALGAVLSLGGGGILREVMFLEGVRFRGLVNDPNLCAVLLVACLPYFLNRPSVPFSRRCLVTGVVVLGVLATGSKTGLATLSLYACLYGSRALVAAWRNGRIDRIAGASLVALAVGIALAPVVAANLDQVAQLSPGADRAISAVMQSDAALNGQGSGRGEAFATAVKISQAAPLLGIGVGSYIAVGDAIADYPQIAHNTYLQLAAEWGLPLAVAFFAAIAALFVASPRGPDDASRSTMVMRDMCYVLLLGGLAVSLNNVRLFWLLLGALYALVTINRTLADAEPEPERADSDALGSAPAAEVVTGTLVAAGSHRA